MDLTHSFSVPAGIDQTWKLLNDLEEVGGCFPGATVESVENDDFSGTVKVKLGPISMQYKGTGTFVERDEKQYRAVIDARGKDKRGNGTASAHVTAQLRPDGDGTAIEVNTDLSVTGKPAQFGRGVIQDVSDKLLDQFVACLSDKLGAGPTEEPPAEPAPDTAQAPNQAQAAGSASAGMAPPQPSQQVRGQAADASDDAPLDLGATVIPVMLKRYAPHIIGGIVVVISLAWVRNRRKARKTRKAR